MYLKILKPYDKSKVGHRPIVEGIISYDKNIKEVNIIVHPLEISKYWVQPIAYIRDNGSWSSQIYIGRPGKIDIGKYFEIRAIANPIIDLEEGDILDNWPDAELYSQIIEVIRK